MTKTEKIGNIRVTWQLKPGLGHLPHDNSLRDKNHCVVSGRFPATLKTLVALNVIAKAKYFSHVDRLSKSIKLIILKIFISNDNAESANTEKCNHVAFQHLCTF